MTGLVLAFLVFDAAIKLIPIVPVTETMAKLGYDASDGFSRFLGVLTLTCVILYAVRRTSVLGAVLLTGLLGGAIASQLRIGAPLFSDVLFGLYVGILAWGGLFLRDPHLRALFPLRRARAGAPAQSR
jgi:hypothetical protein